MQSVITIKDGNVFGFTDVYLEGERAFVRNEETNLGNLSADANAYAFRQASAGDDTFVVSLKNGGGIRAQIGSLSLPDPVTGDIDKLPPGENPGVKPEGGVSQLDIENSLRFNNRLMAFDTTAEGLKALLEHGVASYGNQGRFPQLGGVKFSFDPTAPAGSRVSDIALMDEDGRIIAKLYDDGVLLSGTPSVITVVTLSFTANGGDGYPAKANGSNFRYILDNGTLSAPVDEALDFTAVQPANALGEQDALAEFMQAFHGTEATAFDEADTPVSEDTRIQNLTQREEAVFASAAITGTRANETLNGSIGDDTIDGGYGKDLIRGLGGDDVLNGGVDDDRIFGGDGEDILSGGSGKDRLYGEAGNDTLDGGSGKDKLEGGAGDDRYIINDKDSIKERAGEGTDTVESSVSFSLPSFVENLILTGTAHINGTGSKDDNTITGNVGDNVLKGENGNDILRGGDGDDVLDGGKGDDTLDGGAGADRLKGGDGKDLLDGGFGDDILQGGKGQDTFVFAPGFGHDQIADFAGFNMKGGGDQIQFDTRSSPTSPRCWPRPPTTATASPSTRAPTRSRFSRSRISLCCTPTTSPSCKAGRNIGTGRLNAGPFAFCKPRCGGRGSELDPAFLLQTVDMGHDIGRKFAHAPFAGRSKQRTQMRLSQPGRLALGRNDALEDQHHQHRQ